MIISLKELKAPMIGLLSIVILAVVFMIINGKSAQIIMGGFLHTTDIGENVETQAVFNIEDMGDISERFQRPSKEPALKLKYNAEDFINIKLQQPPYIKTIFNTPEDVIQAYYAILKEASNMEGYHGGCGTIGWAKLPYSYAYELLTRDTRQKMPLIKYVESFSGIGHMTLLKLYPAYQPPDTPANIKYYMLEKEVITGPPYKGESDSNSKPSYFAYYYGLIIVEKTASEGWKIKSIDYVPEDFLCHPMHHWDYDARFLVQTVYRDWYGLVENIEKIEKVDSTVRVYAAGKGEKYRFDFVRLTNGDDVLLHEYTLKDGQWKEVNLLKDEHQMFKFSVLNPRLNIKNNSK